MKLRIIIIIALLAAGIAVVAGLLSGQVAENQIYQQYLETARSNAEREIPYIAVQNYRRVLEVDSGDEGIYREYLEQCRQLSEDHYAVAVKSYSNYFPESADAYELLCEFYYDQEDYQNVMSTALKARSGGVATDKVRDLYLECSVMYRRIAAGFDEATSFVGDKARVKVGGLYGYINDSGSYDIFPAYEEASFFVGDSTAVCKENEWYMMNGQEYKVAKSDQPVESMNFINNGRVLFSADGRYDYMTNSLEFPQELRFEDATNFRNGIAAVKKEGKWALINSNMEMITEFVYEDIVRDEFNTCIGSGIIFAKQNGKYFMINTEGQHISEQSFDDAYSFVSSEPAAVCIGGKWGFADTAGNIVIEPQYDNAKSFQIGLGAVCVDGKWGYINSYNELRMELQFDDCLPFSGNGTTAVLEEEQWSYIKLLPYIG